MNWYRDQLGRFAKRPEIVSSPTLGSIIESFSSIALSDNPDTMSNHKDQPVKSLNDYLHPTRITTPSCIMFPFNTPHQEFKLGMI